MPCEGLVFFVSSANDPLVESCALLAFCCAVRRFLDVIVDSIRRFHVCLQSFREFIFDFGVKRISFQCEAHFCCLGERVLDIRDGARKLSSVNSHVELVHLALRGCVGLPSPDSIIGSKDFKTIELDKFV